MHSQEELKTSLRSRLLQWWRYVDELGVELDSLRDRLFNEDPVQVASSVIETIGETGFIELWSRDRFQDTVESIVLSTEFAALFDEAVLTKALLKVAQAPAPDLVRTIIVSNPVVLGVRSWNLTKLRHLSQDEIIALPNSDDFDAELREDLEQIRILVGAFYLSLRPFLYPLLYEQICAGLSVNEDVASDLESTFRDLLAFRALKLLGILHRRLHAISQLFDMGAKIWRDDLYDPGGFLEGFMTTLDEDEALIIVCVAENTTPAMAMKLEDPPIVWSFGDFTDAPAELLELAPYPDPSEWPEVVRNLCGTISPSTLLLHFFASFLSVKIAELQRRVGADDDASGSPELTAAGTSLPDLLTAKSQVVTWDTELARLIGQDYHRLCIEAKCALNQSETLVAVGALCFEPGQILGNVVIAYENQLKHSVFSPFADELIRSGEDTYPPNCGGRCLLSKGRKMNNLSLGEMACLVRLADPRWHRFIERCRLDAAAILRDIAEILPYRNEAFHEVGKRTWLWAKKKREEWLGATTRTSIFRSILPTVGDGQETNDRPTL